MSLHERKLPPDRMNAIVLPGGFCHIRDQIVTSRLQSLE